MSGPYRADGCKVMQGQTLIAVVATGEQARITADALNTNYAGVSPMSDYEKCGCGFWTLEPQEAWHDESRKYGVVRHRRNAPCWVTPNDPPDSEMVEWTWRRRAETAEAEVERLTAEVNRLSDELGEREAMHFEADAMLVAEQAATKRLTAQLDVVERVLAVHDWIEFDLIRAALRGES